MNQKNDQESINDILKAMVRIIETKSYNKRQLIDFKELIQKIHDIRDKDLLLKCYNERGIHLIYLICRHNKVTLLRYFLQKSHILHYLTFEDKNTEAQYREDILYYAICSNQIKIIKILYDHWTGDLHWSGHKEYNDFDVDKLTQINNLLKAALLRYENWILREGNRVIDQTMMFNVQSLVALSEFQSDLYNKFNELKNSLKTLNTDYTSDKPEDIRLKETEAIRDMVLDMCNCYENHTKNLGNIIQNSVYDIPRDHSEISKFTKEPNNDSELLRNTYKYAFYEVYFRKLDYNICLLILDNLHSLKLRLAMPENSYENLENKIYHFIYHLSSSWRLYIPEKRNMVTKTYSGRHNNIDCFFSINYNKDTYEQGLHIIYLEKMDFENALNVFKTQLQNRNIKENIRMDKTKLPNQETNALSLLPELRDIYSLKRISQHIAQLHSIDMKHTKYVCLLVERTLQVVGEFLKSTNESLHLQPTTEALIEVEISVEIVNDLKNLRDFLCHVKTGELLKRIEIETNDNDIFKLILKELKFIKKKIDAVIMICKPLVEKDLILNGLSLIEKRRNEMPPEVANEWFSAVKEVRLLPQNEPHVRLFEAPVGYADEFATEVIMLVEHYLQLNLKLRSVTERIHNNLIQKFSIYKETMNNSLSKIIEVKKNWELIVKSLKKEIPSIAISDFPNENDFNRIKSYLNQNYLSDNLRDDLEHYVKDNKSFARAEIHWKFIKKLLEFITLKTMDKIPKELYEINEEVKTLSYNDNDIKSIVTNYLDTIENILVFFPSMKCQDPRPAFKGIQELWRKLTKVNFLIEKEKKYLRETLQNIRSKSNEKRNKSIDKMITKIVNDEAIPKRECTDFFATFNFDKKAQKNLMNLAMGYKRDPLHPWCLSKRITILREITKNQSLDQLVAQYKFDKTFRMLLEIVVFDIFAILECTKNNEIVKKSSKLLTEINLRNFLIHGSPLLEIVGNVLDSNDLPTEVIAKTFELLKEEAPINALCALRDLDFDFTQINSDSLGKEEDALVNKFKSSARWKDYLTFIPKLKKTNR